MDETAGEVGPFRLVERIGAGGMGEVWRGVHRRQGVSVAIKVLTSGRARQERSRALFRREARAMARLDHPGIASVLDMGEVSSRGGALPEGAPYLAMEFVEGRTLREGMGSLTFEEHRTVLVELLDALAHAHAQGILHRDLKPANIILASDDDGASGPGRVVLVDFGVAHILDETQDGSRDDRRDKTVSGTPPYMAPEQVVGLWREQGPWTDLYAVGCVAWHMLCGRPPFVGETYDVFRAHLTEPLPAFDPRVEVPASIHRWFEHMLARDPFGRHRRAADAAFELLGCTADDGDNESQRDRQGEARAEETTAHTVGLNFLGRLFAEVLGDKKGDETTATREVGARTGAEDPEITSDLEEAPAPTLPRAPLPERWERPAERRPLHLQGAGLQLWGLRQLPVVDRERAREAMWGSLREVSSSGEVRVVVLEGASGVGKTRLARWLAQRAHEVGAAELFEATHSERGGPLDGLGPMLARHFLCVGLDREDVFELVGKRLRASAMEDGYRVAAITEMIAPEPTSLEREMRATPSAQFSSPAERYAVFARLLEHIGRERPSIVVLDDAHWSMDAIRLTQHILDRGDLSALFVLTVDREQLRDRAFNARALEQLLERDGVRAMRVGALARADHRELVERLLGLAPGAVEDIVDRTGGTPLFAVQLVGDWVERGVLEVTDRGFEPAAGTELVLPDDIHALCSRRIERLVDEHPLERREPMQRALELGAALGRDVDIEEWRDLCARAGAEASDVLVESMLRRNLAAPIDEGWSFASGALRESAERRAREASRWADHHRRCVEMLRARYRSEARGLAARITAHLLEAGELEAALSPLRTAIEEALDFGEYLESQALVEERAALLDELELDARDPRRSMNRVMRAALANKLGRLDEASDLLEGLLEETDRDSRPEIWGRAMLQRGVWLRFRGRHTESLEAFRQAHEVLSGLGSEHLRDAVKALGNLGLAQMSTGASREALATFERVVARATEAGALHTAAHARQQCSFLLHELGRIAEGLAAGRQALMTAREIGNRRVEAHCLNALGYLLRYEERYEQARDRYREALRAFEDFDEHGAGSARVNLSFVDIALGDHARAEARLGRVGETFSQLGRTFMMPYVLAGMACCAGERGDLDEAEVRLRSLEMLLENTELTDRDLAWLTERLAERAREAGRTEMARRAVEIAVAQWRGVGRPERAEALEE